MTYKYRLALFLVVSIVLSACQSHEYRLPASIKVTPQKQSFKCGVKCIVGPTSKSFFHIKAVKLKYIDIKEAAPQHVINRQTIDQLNNYCKDYSEGLAKKSKEKMSYLALNTKSNVYHGQIFPASSQGHPKIPNASQYELDLNSVCL